MLARALVVVALGTAACGFRVGASGSDAQPGGDAPDATPGSDAAIDAPQPLGMWGTPVPVSIPGSTGFDDDPSLTGDLLEMYFNRAGDLYVAKRAAPGVGWASSARVDELSSTSNETTPEVTSDGLTIFFASNRPGANGIYDDIWMSQRATRTAAWGTPILLSSASSSSMDSASAVTDDLLAMVLISTRGSLDADLYLTTRTMPSGPWSTPVSLDAVNTGANDYSPILSQDKLTLYWDSETGGNDDLYTATRASTSAEFSAPVKITELDTLSVEADPWVSPDGRHIAFVSNRTGDYAIYEASR